MAGVTSANQLYTFSAWIRSENTGSVTIQEETIDVTTEWQQFVINFIAASSNVHIQFNMPGTYYLYEAQLEIGNQATDWTPSVEDVEKDMEDTANEASESTRLDILATCDSWIVAAKQSIKEEYVDKTTYDTKMTELDVRAGEIDMRFTSTEESILSMDEGVRNQFNEVYKRISFSEDGITISAGEKSMQLKLDNDKIEFFDASGRRLGWWDGENFYTGNIYISVNERAQFGNFAYVPRSDGSLSFYKVGG